MGADLARVAEEVRVEVFLGDECGSDRARIVKACVVEVAAAQETPRVCVGGVVVLEFGHARLAAGIGLLPDLPSCRGLDAVREVQIGGRPPCFVGAEERAVPDAVGAG